MGTLRYNATSVSGDPVDKGSPGFRLEGFFSSKPVGKQDIGQNQNQVDIMVKIFCSRTTIILVRRVEWKKREDYGKQ